MTSCRIIWKLRTSRVQFLSFNYSTSENEDYNRCRKCRRFPQDQATMSARLILFSDWIIVMRYWGTEMRNIYSIFTKITYRPFKTFLVTPSHIDFISAQSLCINRFIKIDYFNICCVRPIVDGAVRKAELLIDQRRGATWFGHRVKRSVTAEAVFC